MSILLASWEGDYTCTPTQAGVSYLVKVESKAGMAFQLGDRTSKLSHCTFKQLKFSSRSDFWSIATYAVLLIFLMQRNLYLDFLKLRETYADKFPNVFSACEVRKQFDD